MIKTIFSFLSKSTDNSKTNIEATEKKEKEEEKNKKKQIKKQNQNNKNNKPDQVELFSFENLRFMVMIFAIIICVRSSIVASFEVPTASMEPTIKVGDRIIANLLAYGLKVPFSGIEIFRWGEVKRGDIIVFRFPPHPKLDFVKRVIAVGGDRVKIIEDVVYVNSIPINKILTHDRMVLDDVADNAQIKKLFIETIDNLSYFVTQDFDIYRSIRQRSNWPLDTGEYLVPEDSVFVMGDNRDNSHDSRFWKSVSLKNVRGRASFVFWSSQPDHGFLPKIRWYRCFASLYPEIS